MKTPYPPPLFILFILFKPRRSMSTLAGRSLSPERRPADPSRLWRAHAQSSMVGAGRAPRRLPGCGGRRAQNCWTIPFLSIYANAVIR